MPRDPDPLVEIAKAIEHLIRAGEAVLERMLPPLRAAVRAETKRWEKRASDDPDAAAARVHEVFRTLLEILEDLEPDSGPVSPRRASRASSEAKEVRSRPAGAKLTRRRGRWNTRSQ